MAFGEEEDGAKEVDLSKYTREERERARLEAEEKDELAGVDVYDSD